MAALCSPFILILKNLLLQVICPHFSGQLILATTKLLIETRQADIISLGKIALPNTIQNKDKPKIFNFEMFNPIVDIKLLVIILQ